jgi:hypothetical protein
MTDRPPDYAAQNGWDADYPHYSGADRPSYLGSTTFAKRPFIEDAPPYDYVEVTAAAAHRVAMDAVSAMALRHRDGDSVRFEQAT